MRRTIMNEYCRAKDIDCVVWESIYEGLNPNDWINETWYEMKDGTFVPADVIEVLDWNDVDALKKFGWTDEDIIEFLPEESPLKFIMELFWNCDRL